MSKQERRYEPPKVSGNIVWKPTAKPQRISFLGTEFWPVKEALRQTFGTGENKDYPFEITVEQLPILEAMALAAGEGKTPYADLIEALKLHGSILVSLEKITQTN